MFQNTSYVDFDFTIRAPLTRRPPAGHVCRHFRQMYLPSAQLLLHLLLSHLLHVIIPFDMSAADIESGKRLEFLYLQRAGAGARSLCIPAVTSSFEWAGGDSGEKWRDNIHPLSARNPCGEYILCQLNKVESAVLIL